MPGPDPKTDVLLLDDAIYIQRQGARLWMSIQEFFALMLASRPVRCGSMALSNTASRFVRFSTPLPDAQYQVFCFPQTAIAAGVTLWVMGKQADGVTIVASSALTATIGYVAVANQ